MKVEDFVLIGFYCMIYIKKSYILGAFFQVGTSFARSCGYQTCLLELEQNLAYYDWMYASTACNEV